MPRSVVPRQRSVDEWTLRIQNRVRRLEINKNLPRAATAVYNASYSIGAADTWTPDFTSADALQVDGIGLTLDGGGVTVPPGWATWIAVVVGITTSDPPMGEAVKWSIGVGDGTLLSHAEILLNGGQTLAGCVPAWCGWADDPLAVTVGELSTPFGTEFTPVSIDLVAGGIKLPFDGFPGGIID